MTKDDRQHLGELLSAYLDGELPPAQAQKVEKQLEDDPAARELLAELRKVAQAVAQLPREPAPPRLIDAVQEQLEREALLGQTDIRAERAGRNHLAARRFVAVAAILVLVGAVVMIVYTVLFRPPPPRTPRGPVAAAPRKVLSETPRSGSLSVRGKPTAKTLRTGLGDVVENTAVRKESVERRLAAATPPAEKVPLYNTVRLVINTPRPEYAAPALELALAGGSISQVVRTATGEGARQYAFYCSLEQFRPFLEVLTSHLDQQIDLVLPDAATGRELVVPAVTETQLCRLATDPNPAARLACARQFRDENMRFLPRLSAREPGAVTPGRPYAAAAGGRYLPGAAPQGIPTAQASRQPASRDDIVTVPEKGTVGAEVAQAEPELPGLSLLARIDTGAACPECPPELLTRHAAGGTPRPVAQRRAPDLSAPPTGAAVQAPEQARTEEHPPTVGSATATAVEAGRAAGPRWVAVVVTLNRSTPAPDPADQDAPLPPITTNEAPPSR